jgi:hypothetical protein
MRSPPREPYSVQPDETHTLLLHPEANSTEHNDLDPHDESIALSDEFQYLLPYLDPTQPETETVEYAGLGRKN